jgi:hypothetical protein
MPVASDLQDADPVSDARRRVCELMHRVGLSLQAHAARVAASANREGGLRVGEVSSTRDPWTFSPSTVHACAGCRSNASFQTIVAHRQNHSDTLLTPRSPFSPVPDPQQTLTLGGRDVQQTSEYLAQGALLLSRAATGKQRWAPFGPPPSPTPRPCAAALQTKALTPPGSHPTGSRRKKPEIRQRRPFSSSSPRDRPRAPAPPRSPPRPLKPPPPHAEKHHPRGDPFGFTCSLPTCGDLAYRLGVDDPGLSWLWAAFTAYTVPLNWDEPDVMRRENFLACLRDAQVRSNKLYRHICQKYPNVKRCLRSPPSSLAPHDAVRFDAFLLSFSPRHPTHTGDFSL